MFDPKIEFTYASRRAREEEVAAINARGEAAAMVHRKLSHLYSARAQLALLDPDQALLKAAQASQSRVESSAERFATC